MTRYVVLLRGINLGRARRIAMADLRAALTAEGFAGVVTVQQSGNVILDSSLDTLSLSRSVESLIAGRFGMSADAIVRSQAEFARVVAQNPLGGVAVDGARHLVVFLASPHVGALLPDVDLGADRFVVDGAEIHLWCPGGFSDSSLLTALGKAKGGPTGTMRNWNTVEKVLAKLG